jgi:group I intron endonuclease
MTIDWSGFDYIHPRKNKFRKLVETKKQSVGEQLRELNDKTLSLNPSGKTGVYVFHSKIDDMIYIGSAINLEGRRQEHLDELEKNQHPNWMFQLIYHRHGLDNLSFYIIEFCSPKDSLNREAWYIQEFDPEINIAGVRWSTLGLDLKSMNEQEQVREEWYQTEKGKEYKRNTIDVIRAKWAQTPVGKKCIRQDMKNLGDRLNNTNMTEEEKVAELLKWYKEYFPTKPITKETLVKFIKKDTPTF